MKSIWKTRHWLPTVEPEAIRTDTAKLLFLEVNLDLLDRYAREAGYTF